MSRGVAVLLALAAGCAGVKRYPNDAPRNVRVLTTLESGVRAELRVYAVDRKCEAHDLGALALDRSRLELGVTKGRPALLVVTFDTSSFFRGERHVSGDVLFTPGADATYELVANYEDDLYEVSIRELGRRGARELPHRTLDHCNEN